MTARSVVYLDVEVRPIAWVDHPEAVELVVRYPDGSYDRSTAETIDRAWDGLRPKITDALREPPGTSEPTPGAVETPTRVDDPGPTS